MIQFLPFLDFTGQLADNTKEGKVVAHFDLEEYEAGEITYSISYQDLAHSFSFGSEQFPTETFSIVDNKLVVSDVDAISFTPDRSRWFEVQIVAKDATGTIVASGSADIDITDALDEIRGTGRADKLVGDDSMNKIIGGAGDDVIFAKAGDDVLYGGLGRDVLSGGDGADTFLFKSIKESTVKAPDAITLWEHSTGKYAVRDLIDLHAIDANTKVSGNQDFDWIGAKKFSGHAGELRYENRDGHTYVYADVNGDKKADFAIDIRENTKMYADDFLL